MYEINTFKVGIFKINISIYSLIYQIFNKIYNEGLDHSTYNVSPHFSKTHFLIVH